MVIFKNLGINFVHAPKTGGSAVCRALAYLNGNGEEFDTLYAQRQQASFHLTGLHSPCDQALPGITVCFRRDPGSLVQSCFNYAKFRGFFKGSADDFLNKWARGDQMPVPLAFYQRYGRYGYEENCNFVGRFETLEEDFYRLTGGKGDFQPYNQIPYDGTVFTMNQMIKARRIWGK
jgi:hypothetical protein